MEHWPKFPETGWRALAFCHLTAKVSGEIIARQFLGGAVPMKSWAPIPAAGAALPGGQTQPRISRTSRHG
jgi:hypothetical protein